MHTQAADNTNLTVYIQDDLSIEDKRELVLTSLLDDLNSQTEFITHDRHLD
ncbi:hypothetical protein [Pedobacter miscanthi]|uniref:hypothetical protein n=1 Tax=Pedobacter miscanthi TaxID=2259170 RepID=UPI0013145B49|nr:hypothetical protein [Pedobacter miscanthi]